MLKKAIEGIKKHGGIKRTANEYGLLRLLDFGLIFVYSYLSKLLYKKEFVTKDYNFLEAIFYSRDIDYWCRYADVANEIKRLNINVGQRQILLLDCGSGGEGISRFLNMPDTSFTLLDIKKEVFAGIRNGRVDPILADATRLPFSDNSIDIVVSLATTEHIPKSIRSQFFLELKRICRGAVILHFPVESKNGMFRGREFDIKFQSEHKQKFGFENRHTAEHINSGHPMMNELKKTFPNSKIVGRKNCDIWLKYMILERKPLIGFLAGLIYYLAWKKKDNSIPFYECMVTWTRQPHLRLGRDSTNI
ncbi:MAG: class I SAM-dependent methyltransferase [Candidatus Nanoarchaeia archaeon]